LFTLPFFIRSRYELAQLNRADVRNVAVVGLVAEAIVIVLLFVGQKNTSAVNAGFLIRLTFLFTFPFANVIVREQVGRIIGLVAVMMLGGAFLISTGGRLTAPMFGDIFVVFAALGLGFTNAFAKWSMKTVPADIVTWGRFFFGAIFLCAFLVPFIYSDFVVINAQQWSLIVLAAIFYASFVLTFYRGIYLAGPNIAALFFTAGAVFSAVFAVLLLGETITLEQIVGAALLIGGAALLTYKK
ncbi:MAG TPA: DMT family transporter, partial [Methanomicrobia archaeon]|nr:DMT family transporter [Methanomicrobia archaeon]